MATTNPESSLVSLGLAYNAIMREIRISNAKPLFVGRTSANADVPHKPLVISAMPEEIRRFAMYGSFLGWAYHTPDGISSVSGTYDEGRGTLELIETPLLQPDQIRTYIGHTTPEPNVFEGRWTQDTSSGLFRLLRHIQCTDKNE